MEFILPTLQIRGEKQFTEWIAPQILCLWSKHLTFWLYKLQILSGFHRFICKFAIYSKFPPSQSYNR